MVAFVRAIGNLFIRRLSGRLIYECMHSTYADSIVSADTETEVESTSVIPSEVHSLSQNLQKELVGPAKSVWGDHWDLMARHNPVARVCSTSDILSRPADDHGRRRHNRPALPRIRGCPEGGRRARGPPRADAPSSRLRTTYV